MILPCCFIFIIVLVHQKLHNTIQKINDSQSKEKTNQWIYDVLINF